MALRFGTTDLFQEKEKVFVDLKFIQVILA